LNFPLDRRRGVAVLGALVLVLALATVAVASRSPQWTMVFAGGLLLAAGFVVMAPCQLQMSATLAVVVRNLAAKKAEAAGASEVRRSAVLFASGYALFYLPVALFLGGAAWLLGRYAWVLAVAGGLLAITLGLAALGVLRRSWLSRCAGCRRAGYYGGARGRRGCRGPGRPSRDHARGEPRTLRSMTCQLSGRP